MLALHVRNVNDALPLAMHHLAMQGVQQPCRPNMGGSSVIEYPLPVATHYAKPWERVLWCPKRDANPFFHFFEALWILAGRDDIAFLKQFNSKIDACSDNGRTFHGAYGYRLRRIWSIDQIGEACRMLREDPTTRRAAMAIWDADEDCGNTKSKDLPCNDMITCYVRGGQLNLNVFNRSNDIIWGCYGANVVQFSMLQEYMAAHLGVDVGYYTQISTNFHVYEDNPYWQWYMEKNRAAADGDGGPVRMAANDLYRSEQAPPHYKMFEQPELFDADLKRFFEYFDHPRSGGPEFMPYAHGYDSVGFREVAVPLYRAYKFYRIKEYNAAFAELANCAAPDWRVACGMWMTRRVAAKSSGIQVAHTIDEATK